MTIFNLSLHSSQDSLQFSAHTFHYDVCVHVYRKTCLSSPEHLVLMPGGPKWRWRLGLTSVEVVLLGDDLPPVLWALCGQLLRLVQTANSQGLDVFLESLLAHVLHTLLHGPQEGLHPAFQVVWRLLWLDYETQALDAIGAAGPAEHNVSWEIQMNHQLAKKSSVIRPDTRSVIIWIRHMHIVNIWVGWAEIWVREGVARSCLDQSIPHPAAPWFAMC